MKLAQRLGAEQHYKDIFHVNIGEKKFSSSNLIQPTIHRFKWASSKELLMLFRWIDKKASHFTSWDWESHESNNTIQLYACCTKQFITVKKDVFYVFDAAWSPEDTEVLYAGTDIHSGQVVFKVASSDGSYQKQLFTFGENPLEQPSSIADIDE